MTMVDAWVRAAVEDAGRRGLPELRPLLEGLGRATTALRAADWNERVLPRAEAAPEEPGSDERDA